MKHPSGFDFNSVKPAESLVIVAPGNQADMINYAAACRERAIPFIFDPGQSLPIWEADALVDALRGARVLISNDYELELIMDKTGQDKAALLGLCELVITTLGEKGARLSTKDGEREVPVVKPERVVDPTGAGDAFRGGLLKGMAEGRDIYRAALMGSVSASFAVENQGTQTYAFTPAQYQSRLDAVL
jgi:adenosine kinase